MVDSRLVDFGGQAQARPGAKPSAHPGFGLYRGSPRNARNGETPDPNTRTAPQLEAVEPYTIAIIAIFCSREIHKC